MAQERNEIIERCATYSWLIFGANAGSSEYAIAWNGWKTGRNRHINLLYDNPFYFFEQLEHDLPNSRHAEVCVEGYKFRTS